jgi:hypothetical protein
MARISKPAPQRRTEILDTAQQLFTTKGVQATSIEDILKQVGIAKGTLYYHFPSKEAILRALIARTTQQIIDRAEQVAQSPLPAVQKFLAALTAARVDEPDLELAEALHAPGNAEFHTLSIVETVRQLTPILSGIVEEGIAEGVFDTEHPREVIEILLTSAGMLLDDGVFTKETAEIPRRTAGIVYAAEKLLGCEPGTLASVMPGD